ncbi:hypothetical protein PPUN109347_07020 [Pseudomonas putida]|nr:hypothetical protein PPUN109347_07020 [Pseudomonas putida]
MIEIADSTIDAGMMSGTDPLESVEQHSIADEKYSDQYIDGLVMPSGLVNTGLSCHGVVPVLTTT